MKKITVIIIIITLLLSCNNQDEYMPATDFLNICIGENYLILLQWLGKPDECTLLKNFDDISMSGHLVYKNTCYNFVNEEKIVFIPHLNKNIRFYKDFKEIHFYIKNNRIMSWTGFKYE